MTAKVRVNGREIAIDRVPDDVSIVETEAGLYSVLWKGKIYEVRADGNSYEIDGHRLDVALVDPRDPSPQGPHGMDDERQVLIAPMPGRVVRLLVNEGSQVEAGQGILVIEAMKMQNEMKAARAGTVTVQVRQDSAVNAGDLLAVVE